MSSRLILASNFATAAATKKPKIGRLQHHNLRGGMPARLRITRDKSAVVTGSATYDPASLADGAGATTTVTATGAALGDKVSVAFSVDLAGVTLTGYVSSADTVSVRFQNESGGTVDLASGTLSVRVTKETKATLAVYGCNYSNPWAARANTCLFKARGDVTPANLTAADYQFLSNLAYVAFSNYNWLITLDEFVQTVVEIGSSKGATISSGTGTKARVDFTSETDTGDASTTVFVLAADYELLAYCGLQVQVDSVVKTEGTHYSLADDGNGKIQITFVTAPGNTLVINYQLYPKPNVAFGLAFGAPATLKAAGTDEHVVDDITTKDAAWIVTGAGVTGTIDCEIDAVGVGQE